MSCAWKSIWNMSIEYIYKCKVFTPLENLVNPPIQGLNPVYIYYFMIIAFMHIQNETIIIRFRMNRFALIWAGTCFKYDSIHFCEYIEINCHFFQRLNRLGFAISTICILSHWRIFVVVVVFFFFSNGHAFDIKRMAPYFFFFFSILCSCFFSFIKRNMLASCVISPKMHNFLFVYELL